MSSARVSESPLAISVTSCPRSTRASVRYETTRSVPPYVTGGTRSYNGATWRMRMSMPPREQPDHADAEQQHEGPPRAPATDVIAFVSKCHGLCNCKKGSGSSAPPVAPGMKDLHARVGSIR